MKSLVLAVILFSVPRLSFANGDCSSAAVQAAVKYVTYAGEAYICAPDPVSLTRDGDTYDMVLSCTGETGSNSYALHVSFADGNRCSNPTVTPDSE